MLGLFDFGFPKNWDFSKKAEMGRNKGFLTLFKLYETISPIHR